MPPISFPSTRSASIVTYIEAGRAEALASLGWTGRAAEWIALVCLHSGVFVRAQFCHSYGCSPQIAMRFDRRLADEGVASESSLPGTRTNQKLCHIHARPRGRSRPIYPCGKALCRDVRRGSVIPGNQFLRTRGCRRCGRPAPSALIPLPPPQGR